jgi:hypothetical protein
MITVVHDRAVDRRGDNVVIAEIDVLVRQHLTDGVGERV